MSFNTIEAVILQKTTPLMKGICAPAAPIEGSNQGKVIFDKADYVDKYFQSIDIQNQGITKVYVAINDTATALVYNRILKAATALEDGSGGTWNISIGPGVDKISVYCSADFKVSYLLVANPINTRY